MNRREMIKHGCMACIAIGAGVSLLSVSSCTPLPIVKTEIKDKAIIVDPAAFKAEATQVLVRVKQLEYDILLIKLTSGYRAIYMECTHQSSPLNSSSKKSVCTSHGSEFDLEGKVRVGPADKSLKIFPVDFNATENKITIKIA